MSTRHPISAELDWLIQKTREAFQKLRAKSFISSILAGIGLFGLCLLAVVLLEYFFYLPPFLKTSLWVLILVGSITAGYLHFKNRKTYHFSNFYQDYAASVSQPGLKYAFDLKEYPRNQNLKFLSLALQKNLEHVDQHAFSTQLKNYVQSRKDYKQFISFLLLTLALIILIPAMIFLNQSPFARTFNFWETYTPPNPYQFTISPGNVTLEQGQELNPIINFKGGKPTQLALAIKTEVENTFRTRLPNAEKNTTFHFAPLPLNTDVSYYFEMDGYKSQTFRAGVQLRPRFEMLSVHVKPPRYTRLDTSTYSYPFSSISAYPGSEITISGNTNKKVDPLFIIQTNVDDSLVMNSEDKLHFKYQWKYTVADTLHFSMSDLAGLNNKNPFEFVLNPIEDEYPFVSFLTPEHNLEQKAPSSLLLEYEAGDDFGISSTRLYYTQQTAFGDDEPVRKSTKLTSPQNNSKETYHWDLSSLDLKPRDILTFWIEVADNDGFHGSKSSITRKLTLSISSITEYLDKLEGKENDVDKTLDEISDSYQQMEHKYEQFKDELKKDPEQSYEHQKNLEDVQKQQDDVQKKVNELNKKFEDLKNELDQDDVISKETKKDYEELEKLIKQINDPELEKALKELQESMKSLSPQQLRQAMEHFEFNQQRYKERIKRTLELFKQLKLNSSLDKMATAFEELADQENEIYEGDDKAKTQTQKQESIQKEAGETKPKLDSLSVNAPEKSMNQIEQLQKEVKDELKSIDKNIQQNIQQLNKSQSESNSESSKKQQKEIEKQLRNLARQLKSKKQTMGQQQLQVNIRALQYILYSMLDLSEHQETLTQQTENLTSRSQKFVEKARQQQHIQQQFDDLSDSLFNVSAEIPQFSNAINRKKAHVQEQLASAVNQLAERSKPNSTFSQRQSLGGMNELAAMVASLLKQLQNQQGGAGSGSMSMQQLTEQLQKMSGQQQKLNQQIQDFLNDTQGDRLNNDQIERLNQMARQQNAIRKQLKELQKSGQLKDGDRVLSELERLAEQMEETINDLRGGQTDELLIKKQKNILSRMLSAEKALQERGKEKEREATSAEEKPTRVPPDVTLEELQKRIRKSLNDPNQTPYNEDYQKLIEQYFKLLKELERNGDSN